MVCAAVLGGANFYGVLRISRVRVRSKQAAGRTKMSVMFAYDIRAIGDHRHITRALVFNHACARTPA